METRRFERTEGRCVEFVPEARVSRILEGLDAFREAVRNELPEHADAFEATLLEALETVSPEHDWTSYTILPEPADPLRRICAGYALACAGYPADCGDESIDLPQSAVLKSTLFPLFYRYRALCDVLGRERGLPWIKGFIDRRIRENAKPDLSLEDVDGYWRELVEVPLPTSGVAARFSRGKSAFRIDTCLWHDVTKSLNDPEISFLVCCYGDTAGMHALNPSFSYTCATTLVQGDPYCSKCTIDRRHVDAIDPPDRAFFEALGDVGRG